MKSVQQQLLEQKIKQQNRAQRAEERAQANIVANMQLQSNILAIQDPNQLKALILMQMQQMDGLLHKFEGLQKVSTNQEQHMSTVQRQEPMSKDVVLQQLQKDLDEAQREQRQALNKQKESILQMDQIRFELIESKTQAGKRLIKQYQRPRGRAESFLVAQQKFVDEMTLEKLYDTFVTQYGSDAGKVSSACQQVTEEAKRLEEQVKELTKAAAEKEPDMLQRITTMKAQNGALVEKYQRLGQYIQFLTQATSFIKHKQDRSRRDQIELAESGSAQ